MTLKNQKQIESDLKNLSYIYQLLLCKVLDISRPNETNHDGHYTLKNKGKFDMSRNATLPSVTVIWPLMD